MTHFAKLHHVDSKGAQCLTQRGRRLCCSGRNRDASYALDGSHIKIYVTLHERRVSGCWEVNDHAWRN